MQTWKMTDALSAVFGEDSNAAAPILVSRPRPTLFPPGPRTAVQQVQDLAAAVQAARSILAEVEGRLERELARTQAALEGMVEPTHEVAFAPFGLVCQGLEEHYGALELLDAALNGEDTLGDAVALAQQADARFDEAEAAAVTASAGCPAY